MLERMQSIAVKIRWLRIPFLLLAALALVFAGYVAVVSGEANNDELFIPAVLVFSWALLACGFIVLFHVVPPAPDKQMPFLQRMSAKWRRALRLIVALGFLALTVALIIVTYRLISTGIG